MAPPRLVVLRMIAPGLATSGAIIRKTTSRGGTIAVVGLERGVEGEAIVQITNEATGHYMFARAGADGSFAAEIAGRDKDRLAITVSDGAENTSDVLSLEPASPQGWRFGVIGDSIAAATHTNDICGGGDELMNCLQKRLGAHDSTWSYAAGDKSWSISRLAGYTPAAVISAAADSAKWEDALSQAQSIFLTETDVEQVNQVFIGLGANDVCPSFGHDYGGDLTIIAQHIDNTLTYLTNAMAGRPDAAIYMSGTPDMVRFRDVMHHRQHNFVFTSCQALWDLDVNSIQAEARDSLCKGELGFVCDILPANLENELVEAFINSEFDQNNVDEGPCGRVLSSANSAAQRLEAREFNIALNQLMAEKAAQYNGQNNVSVLFTNALFDVPVEPYMVSQLDCYHPSRAGQLQIAQTIWKGLNSAHARTDRYFFDAFENPDKCSQEFTQWGGQCWVDGGAQRGFESRIIGSGRYRLAKNTSRNRTHWVERTVGDLSAKSAAWISFKHRRIRVDDRGDRVDFYVYDADGADGRLPGWVRLDQFRGPGRDVGVHTGRYYDLTPYLSPGLKIRFQTNNAKSMKDGDGLEWDNVSIFAW